MRTSARTVDVPEGAEAGPPSRSVLKAQFALPHGLGGRLAGWVLVKAGEYSGMNLTTLELLALGGDERVLEIGFGPGEAVHLLTERLAAGGVAGVDLSPVMLARARRRNRRPRGDVPVDLRLGSAEQLPWPDGSFDAVFAVNSAQLWAPLGSGIAEVRRVLAPGGRVVLALHQRCVTRAGESVCAVDLRPQLIDGLVAAGFADVSAESRAGRKGDTAIYVTGRSQSRGQAGVAKGSA